MNEEFNDPRATIICNQVSLQPGSALATLREQICLLLRPTPSSPAKSIGRIVPSLFELAHKFPFKIAPTIKQGRRIKISLFLRATLINTAALARCGARSAGVQPF